MSAETLRRAAVLMRERAEAATQTEAPWGVDEIGAVWTQEAGERPPTLVSTCLTDQDAAHIASWHPAVALAVADLLSDLAIDYEDGAIDGTTHDSALAVARTYLGDPS